MTVERIDLGIDWKQFRAAALWGDLEECSTDGLHIHPCHQVLRIPEGISLLEEKGGMRPQYGPMTAFIPAGVPHRTVVMGGALFYHSLYFRKSLLKNHPPGITVFQISPLGDALLDRIREEAPLTDLRSGVAGDCVSLFMKIISADLKKEIRALMLPEIRSDAGGRVARFLEENYPRKITAEDIAQKAALSFRQISRTFKMETGLTVFEYLKIYRMLQASIRFSMTDDKVLTVALDCGYDSLSSFFADFKNTFGLSPSLFRKQYRFQAQRQ